MKSNENFVNLIKKIKKIRRILKKIIMINHDDYKNHLHFLKFVDKKRNDRVHSRKSYIKYKNNVKTI